MARIVEESGWSPRFAFMTMMSAGIAVLGLLLSSPAVGLMRVDELRRGIETLGEATYNAEPYYGKWARSLAKIMIEKGVLSQADLDAKIAELRAERGLTP